MNTSYYDKLYLLIAIFFIWIASTLTSVAQQTPTVKFIQTTDHIPGNDRKKDFNGELCALIKIFVVDDIDRVEGNRIGDIVKRGNVEKWVYMCKGSRNIRIHLRNHLPVKVMFQDYRINGLESNRVYELHIEIPDARLDNQVVVNQNLSNQILPEQTKSELKQKSEPKSKIDYDNLLPTTCFYVQPAIQVGSLMAVGASVGGHISSFNVEAFYLLGLVKSEDIYWNKSGATSVQCSYKPTAFGLRLGYGFNVMEVLRLTPQAGVSAVSIKCSDSDSKGNATSATFSVQADYAVAPHIQVFAAPEVAFAVSKSDIYQQLIDISSKIKSWASGFNIRLGLNVSF